MATELLTIWRWSFYLICVFQIIQVVLNFTFAFIVANDPRTLTNWIEIIFPIVGLVTIIRYDKEKKYVCCQLPAWLFITLYLIWCIVNLVFSGMATLARTGAVQIQENDFTRMVIGPNESVNVPQMILGVVMFITQV